MKNKAHRQHDTLHQTASMQNAGVSMMAVQEVLGLFVEHQTHVIRSLAADGKPTADSQAVLENKPLSYV